MSRKVTLNVPVNRVEGDLEIRVEIQDGVVSDAWCSGTMYRGFENILVGRAPLDSLVITPRVCGICGTAHLTAAARALDSIARVSVPPDAVRLRNLALMTEHVQSDLRHTFLMFAVDFVNAAYRDNPLYEEAARRYTPFQGTTVVDVIRETKRILEMVAIIGGQWPHSSYMVPGGIVSVLGTGELLQCRLLLRQYRDWYERRILGCPLERWLELRTSADLDAWLEEKDAHRRSEVGFFIRYARSIGLHELGRGHPNFISLGALELPAGSEVEGPRGAPSLVPAGFIDGQQVRPLDPSAIAEHVAHSWYRPYEGGLHPLEGETAPYAVGEEGQRYSWAKAPRYDGKPAETGPLAERLMAGDPLFVDLVRVQGANAFVRQLARLSRPTALFGAMEAWIGETTGDGGYYNPPEEIVDGQGWGLTQASRGALGHWVSIKDGAIAHYQIITPTAWHAGPRDSAGIRGITEEALVGTPVRDPDNPVELGHVVRSFDHCLVCTVHTLRRGRGHRRVTLGATP